MSELRLPSGSVSNREVSNTDGNQITEDKLWHYSKYTERFGKVTTDAPSDMTAVLFQADKAGSIAEVFAACVADGSSGSTTFDVQKNGVTILSAVITVNSSTGDGVSVSGTISSGDYVADDVITAVVNETSHTGATGPMLSYSRLEQGN
ncbi:MAG: hypothetical protein IT434_18405 [Phycisphaerales bacterium]|nr:hypothetical protein [Phycisphaerales bacterium]